MHDSNSEVDIFGLVIDISKGMIQSSGTTLTGTATSNAITHKEVLIKGQIPPKAYKVLYDPKRDGAGGYNPSKHNYVDQATSVQDPIDQATKLNIKKFDGASDEWAKFVTDGRAGKLDHNFYAVSGPMLANPKGKNPKAKGSQFAIFSGKAAKLFDKYKACN